MGGWESKAEFKKNEKVDHLRDTFIILLIFHICRVMAFIILLISHHHLWSSDLYSYKVVYKGQCHQSGLQTMKKDPKLLLLVYQTENHQKKNEFES